MLWHYTDRDSAADARGDGFLAAHPVLVRTAFIGGDEVELAPAVWFTVREELPPTVKAKLLLGGWPLDRPGMVWRFGVADDVAPDDLPAWAFPHGYPSEVFRWMLATAQLAGEDWRDWRLSATNVPASLWLDVHAWDGKEWRAAP